MDKLNEQQSAKLASLSVKQQTSAADLQRIALELHLRQWCVEQANIFCQHNGPLYIDGERATGSFALDQVAQSIWNFVFVPLRDA